jgi:hypothetical protein
MHRETPDHWPAIRPKPGQPDTGFTAVPSNFDEESKSVQNTFPPIESAFVAVERACMHYLHAGTGPPMLLIHGLVGSSANWRGNIAALAQAASVYAIDQLNMGRSQRIPGLDAGLEATADRIAAAMEALGLTQVDIVGHSHGGAVALHPICARKSLELPGQPPRARLQYTSGPPGRQNRAVSAGTPPANRARPHVR